LLEDDGGVLGAGDTVGGVGGAVELAFLFEEAVALGDGAHDGVGLEESDLGGEEGFGVEVGVGLALGLLTDDAAGFLAVDIEGGGGFVDRGEAEADDGGGETDNEDEGDDGPHVAPKDPEVVGEREGDLIGVGLGEDDGGGREGGLLIGRHRRKPIGLRDEVLRIGSV